MLPADIGLPATVFPSYRRGQGQAILDLANSPARFDLLNAPTGSGKSLIYSATGLLRDARILVLVSTKGLQRQVHSDFSCIGAVTISGHSSYSCASHSLDPDTGDFDGLECSGSCQYWPLVTEAYNSQYVITNYAHWITIDKSDDPGRLGKFDMIVLDEAHLVPDLLVGLLSVKVSPRSIKRTLDLDTPPYASPIAAWATWASIAVRKARTRYAELNRQDTKDPRALSRLIRLGRDLARLSSSRTDGVKWVVAEQSRTATTLSPVWAAKYADQYLYRGINKVLLSSATLSMDICPQLGIPTTPESMYYREVESTFDPRRRPFIYIPTTRVDSKMSDGQVRILINRIDSWLEDRLDRKGLIHTRSYKHAMGLAARSKWRDVMMGHTSSSAQQVIHRYMDAEPPAVLVSPSVEEGYNFADDLCRHQVIYKVPFINSNDPVIAARLEDDKGYRNYLAAQSLEQMVGRLVRSETDWGETAIFDDHWQWFMKTAKFSKSFKASWRRCDRVPPPLQVT